MPLCRQIPKADAGTRTPDPFITSEVLYQLSYVGVCSDVLESAGNSGRTIQFGRCLAQA